VKRGELADAALDEIGALGVMERPKVTPSSRASQLSTRRRAFSRTSGWDRKRSAMALW
jgi:hypothetical protein